MKGFIFALSSFDQTLGASSRLEVRKKKNIFSISVKPSRPLVVTDFYFAASLAAAAATATAAARVWHLRPAAPSKFASPLSLDSHQPNVEVAAFATQKLARSMASVITLFCRTPQI